jgi:hypothetical protein
MIFLGNANNKHGVNQLSTPNEKGLKSSNPGPQLSFYSFQVDDDSSGDSKGDNELLKSIQLFI